MDIKFQLSFPGTNFRVIYLKIASLKCVITSHFSPDLTLVNFNGRIGEQKKISLQHLHEIGGMNMVKGVKINIYIVKIEIF